MNTAMLMSERLGAWEAEVEMVRERMGGLLTHQAGPYPWGPETREQLLESLRAQLGAVVRELRAAELEAMRRELRAEPPASPAVVRAAVRELAPTTFASEARGR